MEEAMPPVVMYKRHLIHFKGRRKFVLCERPNRACALTAMQNYIILLLSGNVNQNDLMGDVDSETLKTGFQDCLDVIAADGDTKSNLDEVVHSLDSSVVLNPINTSCLSFDENVELLLFKKLEIPVIHGCVLNETIETQHSDKSSITEHGLSQMRAVLGSKQLINKTNKLGDLTVFYSNSQYFILYKHKDDLFTLETDENILSEFPGAIWKRLCMNEEQSFYLTDEFKPTINQQKAKKKLADEWFTKKQETSKKKKKKKKKANNLPISKKGDFTSESCIPSSIFEGSSSDMHMQKMSPVIVKHNLVPIQFKGREKAYLSHKPNEANALVALSSYLILVDPNEIYLMISRQAISIKEMKQSLMSFSRTVILNDLHTQGITKELLEKIVNKLYSCTTLQPLSTSCLDFVECPEVLLFNQLNIMLVHGWVLDNPIEDDGSSHEITARGISQMHDCIDDESVAVLYNRNQFKILHKHDGDIFILESEESSKQRDVVWKKLCVSEKESFYMTENFTPANDDQIIIQQVTHNIDATIESITKADVALLVPVASSQVKLVNDKIRMAYTEVDGCYSGLSCDLFDFKKYLEEKDIVVKSSDDVLSSEAGYIEIKNTFKTGEHKVAVAGPFCQDFNIILGYVMSWLFIRACTT